MSCPFKHLVGNSTAPHGHSVSQPKLSKGVDKHGCRKDDLLDHSKEKTERIESCGNGPADSGTTSTSGPAEQVPGYSVGQSAKEHAVNAASRRQSGSPGVCPFGFSASSSASSPVRPGTPTQTGEGVVGVASAATAADSLRPSPAGSTGKAAVAMKSEGGVCPLGYGATAVAADTGPNGEAKCPLGFTSGVKQRNPLDCARCKSLFFECVVLQCGDRFCRQCAANMQDCILCGADVEAAQPDALVDDLVEQYVESRTGSPALTHEQALTQLRMAARKTAAPVTPIPESLSSEPASTVSGAQTPSQPGSTSDSHRAQDVDESPTQSALAHAALPAEGAEQPLGGPAIVPGGEDIVAVPLMPCQRGEVSPQHLLAPNSVEAASRGSGEGPVKANGKVAGGQCPESQQHLRDPKEAQAQAPAQHGGDGVKESRDTLAASQHSESPEAAGVFGKDGQASDGQTGEEGDGAAFLLDVGVRSMLGGNTAAALSWLRRCEGILKDELEKDGAAAHICSQLGAVCGLQGDCRRQNGDLAEAEEHYQRAVEYLNVCREPSDEVLQALAVSMNKVGDARYGSGDVAGAHAWYAKGLDTRRKAHVAAQAMAPELCLRQVLDLAVSLCKMADVEQVLGNAVESDARLIEARKLLKDIPKAEIPSQGPVLAKYQGVCTFAGMDKKEEEGPGA